MTDSPHLNDYDSRHLGLGPVRPFARFCAKHIRVSVRSANETNGNMGYQGNHIESLNGASLAALRAPSNVAWA